MTGGEAHTELLNRLRLLVRTQGGDWSTQRAVNDLGGWPTPEKARGLLNQLTAEGFLTRRGAMWAPSQPNNLGSFTEQVAQQVATIPSVAHAVVVENPGLIGVQHTDGGYSFVEIRATQQVPEPTLTDAEQREYRREQDDHIHDEPADDDQEGDDQ